MNCISMDQLLLPYLQASDESERQQRLDELLMVHAAPVLRQALRRTLGFYVDQRGINPHNQNAEDLYQEIMAGNRSMISVISQTNTSVLPYRNGLLA